MLAARVVRHDPDGLVRARGQRRTAAPARRARAARRGGARAHPRPRRDGRDRAAAAAFSALNVLPATVTAIGDAEGPMVDLALACGADRLLARITRRSLAALDLAPGRACFAVVKAAAIGRRDLG